jgi:release factor H-coupled RctB family protein
MIKLTIHANELTKNGSVVISKKNSLKIDDIKKIIKNKFSTSIKKIRLFDIYGEEYLAKNKEYSISEDIEIIFTSGHQYVSKKVKRDKTIIKIYANKSYVSYDAVKMLNNTVNRLTDIKYAYGMPDLHAGGFCPIGVSIWTNNIIYPSLIGTDIGCGMSLFSTNINKSYNFSKFGKKIKSIDYSCVNNGTRIIKKEMLENIKSMEYNHKLGTIGNGNHFCEIQIVNKICDTELFEKYGFNKDVCYILVHSGSRGYGYNILNKYQGLKDGEFSINEYMEEHNDALKWAILNRELIAKRIGVQISECIEMDKKIDIFHNFVERDPTDKFWIHRKGCAPSDRGLVVIPGSRGDYSYIVEPTNGTNVSLSLAHGAGRRLSRCSTLNRKKSKDKRFIENKFNSIVICDNPDLIYEEAPRAYKSIECIIDDLVELNFIKVIAIMEPILTYKTKND